jgi:hypothetical protein
MDGKVVIIPQPVDTALENSSRFMVAAGFDGNATVGRFLEFNSNVDSNQSGFVLARNAVINEVAIAVQNNSTVTFTIQIQTPTPITTLTTISLTAARKNIVTGLNISLNTLDELSIRCTAGSCSRPIVFISLRFL